MTADEIEQFILTGAPDARGDIRTPTAGVRLPLLPDRPMWLSVRPEDHDRQLFSDAIRSLLRLRFEAREEIEPAIFGFYEKEIADGAGNFDSPQEQLDWEADHCGGRDFGRPLHALRGTEVWPLVRFERIIARRDERTGEVMVAVSGRAAWDGEHGIQLHFENGRWLLGVTADGDSL